MKIGPGAPYTLEKFSNNKTYGNILCHADRSYVVITHFSDGRRSVYSCHGPSDRTGRDRAKCPARVEYDNFDIIQSIPEYKPTRKTPRYTDSDEPTSPLITKPKVRGTSITRAKPARSTSTTHATPTMSSAPARGKSKTRGTSARGTSTTRGTPTTRGTSARGASTRGTSARGTPSTHGTPATRGTSATRCTSTRGKGKKPANRGTAGQNNKPVSAS